MEIDLKIMSVPKWDLDDTCCNKLRNNTKDVLLHGEKRYHLD
jgi:hypothetical protein